MARDARRRVMTLLKKSDDRGMGHAPVHGGQSLVQ